MLHSQAAFIVQLSKLVGPTSNYNVINNKTFTGKKLMLRLWLNEEEASSSICCDFFNLQVIMSLLGLRWFTHLLMFLAKSCTKFLTLKWSPQVQQYKAYEIRKSTEPYISFNFN